MGFTTRPPKKIFGKDKVITRRGIRLLKLFGVVQSNPVNVVVIPVQPLHSVPFSLLFASSLGAFLYERGAQHTSATIFLGPGLSENSLMVSLFQLTSFISFLKNCLIWARGWKSSDSRPLMGGFTPIEIMAKAFLVSKRTGRIWAEYLRRIQFFRPLSWGTTYPRSSSFHFSGVAPPLVPHQMCSLLDATKQSQKRSGHPF